MIRALVVVLVVIAAGCGSKKSPGVPCSEQVPLPAGCEVACDPTSGAQNTCPSGYHCSPDGQCDSSCTPGSTDCGPGFVCTSDGSCLSDGSGSGDPPVDAGDCPVVNFSATPITPSIQLLIDRSSSMTENFDNDSPPAPGPYKFPTVKEALVGTQGVVTQLEGSVFFGATLFTAFKSACPSLQATPRAKNNRAAIATLINNNPPRLRSDADPGFTPTPLGINAVVADFMAHPAPEGSPPVIVLATDGQPNECTTTSEREAESVAAAKNAFDKGIRLYILGVSFGADDEEHQHERDHLQAMANAGQGVQPGQPNATPYFATNPSELAAAFQQIIGSVVSCDLKISGQVDPADGPNGQLTLNGTSLTYGTDWVVDPDGLTIHLLGNACTLLKSSPNPTLAGTFPCGTVIF